MSAMHEQTPPQEVLGTCLPWDEKERSCLDSTPRIKEKQDKEERVIVTVDSLEEAKSIEDFRKMAIKKCNFNREVKKKKKDSQRTGSSLKKLRQGHCQKASPHLQQFFHSMSHHQTVA